MDGQGKKLVSIQEREVGRASIHCVPDRSGASAAVEALFFLLPGWRPDSRGDTVVTLGRAMEPCLATSVGSTVDVPQSTSHLHLHPCEEAFNSPVQSPLRISSLSGGHLHSLWAGWWPKTGACPTAKTRACC